MRADARRNRDNIVTAAVVELTALGESASMQQIADTAGVSVGALYRHFPDRQSLLESIAAHALTDLITEATAASDHASPWDAFAGVIRRCTELPLGLTHSLVGQPVRDPELPKMITASDDALLALIDRAQSDGSMRNDLGRRDVLTAVSTTVCRPGARPDDPVVTILLDGLRAR
ncbi:TetR/AcrR family transcriptional regulator [Gordonia soli]|uniref:Putative TetR family transcriptional regulator n=1 Tax=Gordonia soli NBRC 108243 TaxID=1223545 RepID=M0QJI1_9ACTN|nr:TetR/AcrR family transcriptional regulator [Gordonia soli]GAC68421.1 putative TetR family transcriptional regulator [Gordonia soli NBRC 108243]